MSKKLVNLKIDHLALVKRGANKVNRSVLKSEVKGKIFKVESSEEANAREQLNDPKEFIKSAEILEDICDIYEIAKGEVQDKLGEVITHYNGKLPNIKKETKLISADELLKEISK